MKSLRIRRASLAGAAVIASLVAMPGSSASAQSGTYVSTAGTSVLGAQVPLVSTFGTTVPLALPLDTNVLLSTSLATVNLDPHMVH